MATFSTRPGPRPCCQRNHSACRAGSGVARSASARVNVCSLQTSSTRASTCPRSTPCSSCVRPRAPPSSFNSWAVGCGERPTRRCSRCSTSWDSPARSSAGTEAACTHRRHPRRSDPPVEKGSPSFHRLLDHHGPRVAAPGARQLKSQIANRWQQIVAEFRAYGERSRVGFLDDSAVELSDILRRGCHSWTRLRRDADLPTHPGRSVRLDCSSACAPSRTSTTRDAPRRTPAAWTTMPRLRRLSDGESGSAHALLLDLVDGGGHETYDGGLRAPRRSGHSTGDLIGS